MLIIYRCVFAASDKQRAVIPTHENPSKHLKQYSEGFCLSIAKLPTQILFFLFGELDDIKE